MRYVRLLLFVLAAAVTACACQVAPAAPPDLVEHSLGEAFGLEAGQQATIAGDGLRLTFDAVLADSRCPSQVECFWSGEARITLIVQPLNAAAVTVEFNTNPAPGQNKQTAVVGRYSVRLQSLDPYPDTTEPIEFSDYRAVLVVDRA